jgi:hypothetical protein
VRNLEKLQGPVCKTKFPVDLKPKWRNAQNESWRVFQTLQYCFRAQVQKLKTYIFTRESSSKSQIWITFVLKNEFYKIQNLNASIYDTS